MKRLIVLEWSGESLLLKLNKKWDEHDPNFEFFITGSKSEPKNLKRGNWKLDSKADEGVPIESMACVLEESSDLYVHGTYGIHVHGQVMNQ
jgi:hypothetical protein